MGRTAEIISLYWPIIVALFCVAIGLLSPWIFSGSGSMKVPFFLGSLDFKVQHPIGLVVPIIVGLTFLMIPPFRDYSGYFPETLRLSVFFDNNGIVAFMESLPEDDMKQLSVAPNWRALKSSYFTTINKQLEQMKETFRFYEPPGRTLAKGIGTFKVQMINRWGAQLYKIYEARGYIEHTSDSTETGRQVMFSEFDLIETEGAIIRGSISALYVNHGLLIMPQFRQTYRLSLSKTANYDTLTAATRIDLFPYPNISKTLYLAHTADGLRFPIAYGIYSPP